MRLVPPGAHELVVVELADVPHIPAFEIVLRAASHDLLANGRDIDPSHGAEGELCIAIDSADAPNASHFFELGCVSN